MSAFADLIPQNSNPFSDLVPQLKGDLGHQAAAGLISFGQGAMPVFDEAGAGVGAAMEKIGLLDAAGKEGESLSDAYDARLKNIRQVETSFHDQHPVLDPALRIAGGVTSIAALPGSALKVAAEHPYIANTAYGALQGFTGGEGGSDNRLLSAGGGAAVGAGATAVARNVVDPLINAILDRKPAVPLNLKGNETDTILKNLDMADITPQEYADALRNSSSEDFAGEVGGEPLRMLTQTQSKISSPAMQRARQAMRQRLAEAPDRASNIVQDALGSDQETNQLLSALDIAKGAEGTLYKAAEGQMVPRKPFLDVINTPAGQKAMKATVEKLMNKGIDPTSAGIVIDGESGFIGLAKDVRADIMHEVAKSMGDLVERNPVTGNPVKSADYDIEGLRKNIVDNLRGSSLEFNAAQENAAQVRQAEDALSLGRELAKKATGEGADEATAQLIRREQITPFSQAGFKQGLQDNFGNTKVGTGNPIAALNKQRTFDRTAQLFDQGTSDKLKNAVLAEEGRMETANRALYGSNTPEMLGQIVPDVPKSMGDAVGRGVQKVKDFLNQGSNKRLAQALYSTSAQDKAAVAAAILKASGSQASFSPVEQNAIIKFLREAVPLLPAQTAGAVAGGQQ